MANGEPYSEDTWGLFDRLRDQAGWTTDTLLLVVARWVDDQGPAAAAALADHLALQANEEADLATAAEVAAAADPQMPSL